MSVEPTRDRDDATMTATTVGSAPHPAVPPPDATARTAATTRAVGPPAVDTVVSALRSEWTKLWTVRSTYWTLFAAFVIVIGLGAIICGATASSGDPVGEEPAAMSLSGIFLAQIALGVLGVLVISSEYGSGMIKTTVAAVPNRPVVLAAKAAVFAPVVLVSSVVACLSAFLVGQWLLSPTGHQTSLSEPGTWQIIIGAAGYLTLVGLIALGLGGLIRHTAGALGVLVGILVVLQIVAQFLPQVISY